MKAPRLGMGMARARRDLQLEAFTRRPKGMVFEKDDQRKIWSEETTEPGRKEEEVLSLSSFVESWSRGVVES